MTTYRAIVSVTFDDDDIAELADELGVSADRLNAHEAIDGELDNLSFGAAWLEQLFVDGEPTISRLTDGVNVEINPHEAA